MVGQQGKTDDKNHGLRTSGEEIPFTAQPKINSQSKIFRYSRSMFCLPHRPKFSDFFDLCFHWVSVVRDKNHQGQYIHFLFLLEKLLQETLMKFFDITNLNRHYVWEQMGLKFINLHIRNVLFFVPI